VLDPERLDAATLAEELCSILHFRPRAVRLDLNGTRNTAELVATMVRKGRPAAQAVGAGGARR
jgi:predicted glycosyltransferase